MQEMQELLVIRHHLETHTRSHLLHICHILGI